MGNSKMEPVKNEAIHLLKSKGCSCVIANGVETRMFWKRGVADLYVLLKYDKNFLENAFVADKVIGRAVATLMVLGKVREVYALVVSEPALELFEHYGIPVEYEQKVPYILNRSQTDICPLEDFCSIAPTAEEGLTRIEFFLANRKVRK